MKKLIFTAFLLIGMIGYAQAEQPQENKKMLETIKSCMNNHFIDDWVICFKTNSKVNKENIAALILAIEKNNKTRNKAILELTKGGFVTFYRF